ncbi:MAG: DUF751 family protein [Hydrococcus sp. C42_A2020_068]|jgi:hypothetical protein|uniref:DUF751 family protein n=1 Tax=Pleurocapsa sp. PCC 7327 TaxID=118163 RepID=UPI00029FBEBC|nr:DUF751 family protein [Pleurocapsa sp. PCC 7327]AFY75767.1 Protein of unknown function (DUF751) [Pleurocapsa sp. PCC 7327]MBF2020456.1 DUF751 family protein [Hydrococcus sp. C42_A2020_068]
MKDFFINVSRYPTYLLSLILGIFIAFFDSLKPWFKNPVTAIAIVGILAGGFAFIAFTLRAMLGLSAA